MEENDDKSWWDKYGWVVILIFFVVALIVIAYKALHDQEKNKEERKKKREALERNRTRINESMRKRKKKKRWLDFWFFLATFFTRLLVLVFGAYAAYTAKYYYPEPVQVEHYLTALAFWALCFSALAFLFFGIPTDVRSTLKELNPRLRTLVYGKYLGIKDQILFDEERLDAFNKALNELDDELE